MPKFFCDYCDVYLTHDSMSVRKAHNSGRNHLRNVVDYYQQIGHEKAQSVIDSITSSYAAEGQAHNNPMLPQNQPGSAFPPPFPFPGGPPPFPGMPAGAPPFPQGMIPPPGPGGRGMPPMPPFPPGPNGAMPPGGLPFPPPGGLPAGLPFPPPGAPGSLPRPTSSFRACHHQAPPVSPVRRLVRSLLVPPLDRTSGKQPYQQRAAFSQRVWNAYSCIGRGPGVQAFISGGKIHTKAW
ncbi:U1 small nuclear ribonucleoprotein C [Colletotrichum orbiculare MAFF 240422]|uniref:U1 small nuclear ribonucleoprotein C n=1 Tax=Colletotrichum orbiculare (strain 104-T / ATCC 96160 / CBS 514.97 / LARS 414 / MAFF 240422) TaxID=1213857 RepID=N4V177_COLOR|nr:U1 small nuclear ribonucleoprotein C [Colletotrichum orbiculare MAFF 240422]